MGTVSLVPPWGNSEGHEEDSVIRRERFSGRHPEVEFSLTPAAKLHVARYRGPDGSPQTSPKFYWLDQLIDFLEEVYGEHL